MRKIFLLTLFLVLFLCGCTEKHDVYPQGKGFEMFTYMRAHLYGEDPSWLEKGKTPEQIIKDPKSESRSVLTAWYAQRLKGVMPPEAEKDRLLGVIVEWAFREEGETRAIAIAGYADDDTRLFFSSGGGYIGDKKGWPESMKKAVRKMLATGKQFVAKAAYEQSHPLPKSGKVRFVFLTPGGVKFLVFPEVFIQEHGNDLYYLYSDTQDLLTQYRLKYMDKKTK